VVLDSVLFTVALLQGYEALHAGAVATPDGVIAITSAAGGGKSTLLAALLQRGLALMADDVLVLESRGTEATLAHPAAPLMTVPAAPVCELPLAADRAGARSAVLDHALLLRQPAAHRQDDSLAGRVPRVRDRRQKAGLGIRIGNR
jgi:hypothetical protein